MTITFNAMWVRDPSRTRGPVGTLTLPTEILRGEPGYVTFTPHGGSPESAWFARVLVGDQRPRTVHVEPLCEPSVIFLEMNDDAKLLDAALERLECDGAPRPCARSWGGWIAGRGTWEAADAAEERYGFTPSVASTLARLFDQHWPAMARSRCRVCSGPCDREGLCDECALTTCAVCDGTGSSGRWDYERRAMVDGVCPACMGTGKPPMPRARVLTPVMNDRCVAYRSNYQPMCGGACGYVEKLRQTLGELGDERGELAVLAEQEAWMEQSNARRQPDGRWLVAGNALGSAITPALLGDPRVIGYAVSGAAEGDLVEVIMSGAWREWPQQRRAMLPDTDDTDGRVRPAEGGE